MIEYIKREDVLNTFCENCIELKTCDRDSGLCDDLYPICKLPAADVVEVVRCKDCVHWGSTLPDGERKKCASDECVDLVCDYFNSDGFLPNDYCSFAEKRGAK